MKSTPFVTFIERGRLQQTRSGQVEQRRYQLPGGWLGQQGRQRQPREGQRPHSWQPQLGREEGKAKREEEDVRGTGRAIGGEEEARRVGKEGVTWAPPDGARRSLPWSTQARSPTLQSISKRGVDEESWASGHGGGMSRCSPSSDSSSWRHRWAPTAPGPGGLFVH